METGVKRILQLEGLAVLWVSLLAYSRWGAGWGGFVLGFLALDAPLLLYLLGPWIGAWGYNLSHSYVGALLCLALGAGGGPPLLQAVGLIWTARIGFDRGLGWGLKSARGVAFTHLGVLGSRRSRQ